MLLKRQEKENLIKVMYNSSNILASTYDKNTNDLTLIFNKGGRYKYTNVSLTDYTRFELAESQGKVFNTHIKTHSFEKLESVEVNDIVVEIETLKAIEDRAILDAKTKEMIEVMSSVISTYGSSGKINYDLYRNLETKMKDYDSVANQQPKNKETV